MPVSVERFLQALAATGILSPAEVQSLSQSLGDEQRSRDADELARDLVRQGKLTRFQAAAIYQEKSDGLLLGNYLILDKLGAGGMGQVFRAKHRRMDRVVALKVLAKKLLDSPDSVARFQREVKAAARLTHPNIVTAYDADEAGGMHFLVMEYVDGADLASIVKKQGVLPLIQALDFLLQATRGLEHAHELGIVHRDIKPSNLLLDKKGTIKILDMGLARIADPLADPQTPPAADLTHTGSIMGTIDYMAPEQAMDSRKADARSDLYSLGCSLHYLLTGRPPYAADTVMKRLTAHQQATVPILSGLRPDIPPAVDQLFARMMAKQPGARFQTAKELAAAIEALSKEPEARPVPAILPPIAAVPVAVPVTPLPSGVQNAESVVLPGIEQGRRRKPENTSARRRLAAVAVLLLVAACGGGWFLSGSKRVQPLPSELASLPKTEHVPAAETSPAKPAANRSDESITQPSSKRPGTPQPAEPTPAIADPEPMLPVVSPLPVPTVSAVVEPTSDDTASKEPAPLPLPTAPAGNALPPDASPAAEPAPARLPVPSAEAQRASLELIKDLFKDEYAQARRPEDKLALAGRLLDESARLKDDNTAWYVLVHEASELAVDAANPDLVERAIDMLSRRFAITPLEALALALTEMAASPHPADANRAIAEAALARIDEAQEVEDYDDAKRLADAASTAARKAKDPALMKRTVEASKTLAAARRQWEAWEKAQETLTKNSDDPDANLAAGRYLCFVQGAWEQGLVHLTKGSDESLKELASASVKSADEPAAQVELGDAWFAALEKAKGKDKGDLSIGAAYWYKRAEPGLSGLSKAKVEKRLAELGGEVPRDTHPALPVANGLVLPQTFDCQSRPYPITLGPSFELGKSWTLSFDMQLPNLEPGSHMIFYWGDSRAGRNPMAVGQDDAVLHVWMGDCKANQDHELLIPLGPAMLGRWLQLVVRFDAASRQFAAYINGALARQEPAKVVPNFDKPMPLWIGSDARRKCRFFGQVRQVWLGNQDDFAPPGTKASLAHVGLRPRAIKNVGAYQGIGTAAAPINSAASSKKVEERQLATLVLGFKGTVVVDLPTGETVKVSDASALPAGRIAIVELRLSNISGLDEAALSVRGLPWLKKLWLNGNTVGDAGLSQLADLPALEELNVSGGNRITDLSMPALARLTSLNDLVLNSSQLTDVGLAQLKTLVRLKHFSAVGTRITGSGFAQWAPNDVLNHVNASNTPFDDKGVDHLRRFVALDTLDLNKTRVTNQGVASLAGNTRLRNLYLREDNISDAGLQNVARLVGLKSVLLGSSVSDKGMADLRLLLPGCRVDR